MKKQILSLALAASMVLTAVSWIPTRTGGWTTKPAPAHSRTA